MTAQSHQCAAQKRTQRSAGEHRLVAIAVTHRYDLECTEPLHRHTSKHDDPAGGQHQPQGQFADMGQQIFAPGVKHRQAAHCRPQHQRPAAQKTKQSIMERAPHRLSLHKGQSHQQKTGKQRAQPRRHPLLRAAAAAVCFSPCR